MLRYSFIHYLLLVMVKPLAVTSDVERLNDNMTIAYSKMRHDVAGGLCELLYVKVIGLFSDTNSDKDQN